MSAGRLPGAFWRLWAGETLSMSGGQVAAIAIPLVAVDRLHAGSFGMGLLGASASFAPLVFGLHAGVVADTHSRKRIMIACHVLRAVLIAAAVALIWTDHLRMWALASIVFLIGALELFIFSALTAVVPSLVPSRHLDRANAWVQGMENTGEVVGPGLAGFVIARLGLVGALVVNLGGYLTAATIATRLPPRIHPPAEEKVHLLSGLRIIRDHRTLRGIAATSMFFNVFSGGFFALYILFLVRTLDLDAGRIGLVGMVGGLGGLLGAVLAPRLIGRLGPGRVLALGYTVPGLGGLVITTAEVAGRVPGWIVAGAGLAIWSCFVVILVVDGVGIYQRAVPDSHLGRLNSAMRFLTWGVEPLGAMAAGTFAAAFGLGPVMVTLAAGCAASGIVGACWGVHRYTHPVDAASTDDSYEGTTDEPHHAYAAV